jgi:O-antigen ligase
MKESRGRKKKPSLPPLTRKKDREPIIAGLLVMLYMAVEIIPSFQTADITGPQWLYLSILNLVTAFIIFRKDLFTAETITSIIRQPLSLVYIVLFLLAGLSAFIAFNQVESLVALSKFANTLAACFMLAVLLKDRLHLLRFVAWMLTIILAFQSLSVLSQFFKGLNEVPLSELIYNLKGTSGNKNILAAAISIKVPFALFIAWHGSNWQRIIIFFIITIALLAIAFLNARTAYLSILCQLLAFITFCIYIVVKERGPKKDLGRLIYFVLPALLAFMLSTMILRSNQENEAEAPYGTVAERLGNIEFTVEGTNARLFLWSNAIDQVKKNPLMGCGYGNWKIASIPYEREFFDNLIISYHAHNDFLEMAAELGWTGGLLYFSIFLLVAIILLRTILLTTDKEKQLMAFFVLLAFTSYTIDAALNFPNDRTALQVYFAIMLAIALNLNLPPVTVSTQSRKIKLIFIIITWLFIIPATIISTSVFRSLKAQFLYNKDAISEKPRHTWSEVKDAFPSIPNLNTAGFPIDLLKARYLMESKQYSTAFSYLRKADEINPHLTFSDFLRSRIYLDLQQPDSAFYYANKAFSAKPRADNNYLMLLFVCYNRKDTSCIEQAFQSIRKYRDESWIWNEYISVMGALVPNSQHLAMVIDSAYQKFPNDPSIRQKKGIK